MTLQLAPLQGRSRSAPWFQASDEDRQRGEYAADVMSRRDELFLAREIVGAYMVFALAQREMGVRLNVERLEMKYDETVEQDRPIVVSDAGMAVSYFDPSLEAAVLHGPDGRQVIAMRTDAVTHIEIATP